MGAAPPPTILNVDDHPAARYAVSRLLRHAGFVVREAGTGTEALRLAGDNPDLVVLDLNLPDISGLEVCRQLKADPRTASIPVLHLTASHSDAKTWVTALDGGADAFLVEPADPAVLLATVRSLLRARTAEERLRLSEARLRFLAEASRLLATADDEQALRSVCAMAVPELADWAVVDLVEPDRAIRRIAAEHADPLRAPLMERLRAHPPGWHSPSVVATALRTGTPQIVTSMPLSWIDARTNDSEHARTVRELDPGSFVVAPITAGATVLGAVTWARARGRTAFDAADVTLLEDVAGRAAAALDRSRRLREAEEQNRLKDEFLAVLSHELRTPLNAIVGWAEILRTSKDPSMSARAIDVIARNAHLEAKLIADILEISRAVARKTQLQLQALDLRAVVEATVETVRPAAAAKSVRLESAGDEKCLVQADSARVQQVVSNLLANAIAFTPTEGLIAVSVRRVGEWGEVVVSDTGEGIRPEFLPYVFEPFRQEDNSPSRTRRGLGLGLAIVRELVRLHGGDVFAASEGRGKGSAFTVRLPAAPDDSSPSAPATAPPAAAHPEALIGLRVVVVDDDADTLDMVRTFVGNLGAEVRTAPTAGAALALVKSVRPDVLVADIGMPAMDGYALMREIRSLPAEGGGLTLAVALTAYAREQDRLRALVAGFQAHMAKPVSLPALATLVAALGRRKA